MGQIRNYNKIRKYLGQNKNKNTIYHNLWPITKLILKGKFIVLSDYIREKRTLTS